MFRIVLYPAFVNNLLALRNKPHAAIGQTMISTKSSQVDNRRIDDSLRAHKALKGANAIWRSLRTGLTHLSTCLWRPTDGQHLIAVFRSLPQVSRDLATSFTLFRISIALNTLLTSSLSAISVRPLLQRSLAASLPLFIRDFRCQSRPFNCTLSVFFAYFRIREMLQHSQALFCSLAGIGETPFSPLAQLFLLTRTSKAFHADLASLLPFRERNYTPKAAGAFTAKGLIDKGPSRDNAVGDEQSLKLKRGLLRNAICNLDRSNLFSFALCFADNATGAMFACLMLVSTHEMGVDALTRPFANIEREAIASVEVDVKSIRGYNRFHGKAHSLSSRLGMFAASPRQYTIFTPTLYHKLACRARLAPIPPKECAT